VNRRSNLRTWYGLTATVCGAGYISKMPGTIGTLIAMLILILAGGINNFVLIAVILLGTYAADAYARANGREDPGEVVIDEVAGYWTSMLGLGVSYAVIAFFLFRVIDILKPFPVRNMERLPGGIGIMADDICGGIIVNLLMRLLSWLFFSDGFGVLHGYLGFGG
jgi:phosphatidylglycerophosphatase A